MCPFRLSCLEVAVVWRDAHGVWGGMAETERKQFVSHLRSEGYGTEPPTGVELEASIRSFYRARQRRLEQRESA